MASSTYVALTGFNYPDPDDDEKEIRVEPGEKVSLPESVAKKLRAADAIATQSDVKKLEAEEKAAAEAEAAQIAAAQEQAEVNAAPTVADREPEPEGSS